MDISQFVVDNAYFLVGGLIGFLIGAIIKERKRDQARKVYQAIALETLLIERRGRLAGLMSEHDIFVSRERLSIVDETWLNFEYFRFWPMVMAYVLDEVVGDIYASDYLDRRTAYDDLVIVLENNGSDRIAFAQKMEQYSDRSARGLRVAILRYDRDFANNLLNQKIAIELSIGAVSDATHVVEVEKPAELPAPNN